MLFINLQKQKKKKSVSFQNITKVISCPFFVSYTNLLGFTNFEDHLHLTNSSNEKCDRLSLCSILLISQNLIF